MLSYILKVMSDQLFERAKKVLADNDRGAWTVPSGTLYPHQWLWDSCFIAIGLRHINVARAQTELESLLRGQWTNGMLPHIIFSKRQDFDLDELLWDSSISSESPSMNTTGITQPPMLAEAVLAVGQKLSLPVRRTWFRQMLPGIIKFHEWLYRERDPNNEGLVTLVHPYESGLDNSPPWIEELKARGIPLWVRMVNGLRLGFIVNLLRRDTRNADADQRMNTAEALSFFSALRLLRRQSYDSAKILKKPYLAVQDLVFNCVLIRSNTCLAEIAKTAGVTLPDGLVKNMERSELALEKLWDEATGQYYCRSFSRGKLIRESSIAALLPLYTGVVSRERAQQLVEMMKKRSLFKVNWPLPSVPTSSIYFNPAKYWQGPTWVNTNWFVIRGLERSGFKEEADTLRQKTLEMVAKSGCREYFNPLTGEGLGAENFSWTAALVIDLTKN